MLHQGKGLKIFVAPKEKRNPEIKGGLGNLGSLRTIPEGNTLANESAAEVVASGKRRACYITITFVGQFLADVPVPTNGLLGCNKTILPVFVFTKGKDENIHITSMDHLSMWSRLYLKIFVDIPRRPH